jgi:hypothetical protein
MRPHRRNTLIGRPPNRRGYALVLVLLFNVMFLLLLGVAWRQIASALRIASVHSAQVQRDEGSLRALAEAMRLLETGLPPANPYVRGTTITLQSSGEERFYLVTFQRDETRLTEQVWLATVARTGERPTDLLPPYFPTANP